MSSNAIVIIYVILSMLVIIFQRIRIQAFKKGMRIAVEVLQKYASALELDEILRKVQNDESEAD